MSYQLTTTSSNIPPPYVCPTTEIKSPHITLQVVAILETPQPGQHNIIQLFLQYYKNIYLGFETLSVPACHANILQETQFLRDISYDIFKLNLADL